MLRDYVLKIIENSYKSYGFEPLYTPIIENEEVFNGHHGEGEKLLFKLKDKNNENYVLKYDSTVPLARVVSMYDDIKLPYKRYQLQQSYRDDDIDKGHYREFIQCDCDIVGAQSLVSDSELVLISYDGLHKLGFDEFTIRLNHRKIIKAIAEKARVYDKEGLLEIQRAIDFADKITKDGIKGIELDLEKRNVNPDVIKIIIDLIDISNNSKNINDNLDEIECYLGENRNAKDGLKELKCIVSNLPNHVLDKTKIDFTLARGADYYTGFIIEAVINNIELGAVLGGGRYDNLVASFSNKNIPAVGMAFGMERLIVAMKELGLDKQIFCDENKILIYADDSRQKEAIELSSKLREKYNVSLLLHSDLDFSDIRDYCSQSLISTIGFMNEDGDVKIERINDDLNCYDILNEEIKQYQKVKHK